MYLHMSNSTIFIGNNSQLFGKFTFPKVDLCSLALNFCFSFIVQFDDLLYFAGSNFCHFQRLVFWFGIFRKHSTGIIQHHSMEIQVKKHAEQN